MLIALSVVAVVMVLAIVTVHLDRRAAAFAERTASALLSGSFGGPVDVRVEGTPFLTQALRGRYRDVHVTGGGLRIGAMDGATLDSHLRNTYLPLRQLLGRQVDELSCEHLQGRVVLPYAELARVANVPGLGLAFAGGQLHASAAVPIAGVSGLARVNGEAVWTVGGGGSVWLRIRGVSVVGVPVPTVVMSQLLPSLNVPIPLPELPFGLRIDHLEPVADGLIVTGSAPAPTFRRR